MSKRILVIFAMVFASNAAHAYHVYCAKNSERVSPIWGLFYYPSDELQKKYQKQCREKTGSSKIKIECQLEKCGQG